ncbi:ligand-binding sensor domain-containing protein [Flectobacillus longus]|uniref:ligand-binding sensor domain-containing protein n=1 Tax=Flectobacillus longus TaxID=2984207 RepID=UPI0024B7FBB8|nr:two-component regulator propeller domain-containing protein [Flectobacillus longus]MDI9882386.1 two-component regulator propeller domain-containing protein [Flectobacillus longus]
MAKLRNPIFSLLLVSIFLTSCNGQPKTEQSNETVVKQQSFTSKKNKLTKTQGSNEYQGISCGLEDKKGNIWFATGTEGVFCFDGKSFIQFTEKDGLNSNSIRSILEDRKGNIWFATNKGICYYNGKTFQQISNSLNVNYQSFNFASPNPPLINDVYSIMQDKKGILWFGTVDGVVCYDGNNFTRFLDNHIIVNDSNLTLKSMQCMFEDKIGNLWFGSGPMAFEGIAFFDGKTLTKFKPQNETWVRKITEDRNGTLLFNTRHFGMITYNGKTFSDYTQPQNLRRELLQTMLADSKGNIWYGSDYTNDRDITTGGLWKFDGKSINEFTKKDGLSNTSVTLILESKNGTIWVGTRNCGLYRYNGQTFETFSE